MLQFIPHPFPQHHVTEVYLDQPFHMQVILATFLLNIHVFFDYTVLLLVFSLLLTPSHDFYPGISLGDPNRGGIREAARQTNEVD